VLKGGKPRPSRAGRKSAEGLKLKKLYFDDKNNIGLCQWEVDDINKLLEAAKQLNIDWDIKIIENPKELYKKGLF
jgi:predicted amidohydrolase YtcJ